MAGTWGAMLKWISALAVLSTVACGKCPDGTDPDENCVCGDQNKTKLEPPTCTPKSAAAAPSGLPGIVAREDYETGGPRDDWQADGSQLANDGKSSAHPPGLMQGETATTTFGCDGKPHTQFRFFFNQIAAGATLELYVDGELWETFTGLTTGINNILNWHEFLVNVPEGVHSYAFKATAQQDVGPAFILDTLVCRNLSAQSSAVIDFDDGFVPPEIAGDWIVSDTPLVSEGEAAVHPKALRAGQDATLNLDCGGQTHTQLGFYFNQLEANATLEMKIDGKSRETFKGYTTDINPSLNWYHFVMNVERGAHSYEFIAHAVKDVGTPFVLDTFTCRDVEPAPEPFGHVDFDDGFVPTEVSGDWVIDNTRLKDEGEAAIHPLALKMNQTSKMQFTCDAKSTISFALNQLEAAATLELVLDDAEPVSYTGMTTDINPTFNWHRRSFAVEAGTHVLKFTATAQGDVAPPFTLDTFVCE